MAAQVALRRKQRKINKDQQISLDSSGRYLQLLIYTFPLSLSLSLSLSLDRDLALSSDRNNMVSGPEIQTITKLLGREKKTSYQFIEYAND